MRVSVITRVFGIALACVLFAASLHSAAHAAGPVILTVTGTHAETGEAITLDLTLADVAALESEVLRTTTLWTDGEIDFTGVRMDRLFGLLNMVQPDRVQCTALNQYKVELPLSDAQQVTVLMAYARDGAYMKVRDKGPLWIIYPRDADIDEAANRMIWQLRKLEAVY